MRMTECGGWYWDMGGRDGGDESRCLEQRIMVMKLGKVGWGGMREAAGYGDMQMREASMDAMLRGRERRRQTTGASWRPTVPAPPKFWC